MSTSLLYHAFCIRGYKYRRTKYDNGQVIFTISQESETYRCSSCGSAEIVSRGQVARRLWSLPIGTGRHTWRFACVSARSSQPPPPAREPQSPRRRIRPPSVPTSMSVTVNLSLRLSRSPLTCFLLSCRFTPRLIESML